MAKRRQDPVKARDALGNISRAAALSAMALVIVVSLQAGVELIGAVLRGIAAFLIVHWILGAAADAAGLVLRSRRRAETPSAPEAPGPRERG